MASIDNRLNDNAFFAVGFDYGPFSIDLVSNSNVNYGFRGKDSFDKVEIALNRFGVGYQNENLRLSFLYGKRK